MGPHQVGKGWRVEFIYLIAGRIYFPGVSRVMPLALFIVQKRKKKNESTHSQRDLTKRGKIPRAASVGAWLPTFIFIQPAFAVSQPSHPLPVLSTSNKPEYNNKPFYVPFYPRKMLLFYFSSNMQNVITFVFHLFTIFI